MSLFSCRFVPCPTLKGIAVVFIVGCLVGVSVLGFCLHRMLHRPMLPTTHAPLILKLDPSTSAISFAHLLKKHHLIESERLFLVWIRLQGFSTRLKAGIYQLEAGETIQQFLVRVVSGDVLKMRFRIIEGSTEANVSTNLSHAEFLTYQPQDWLAIAASASRAEGLLLADTYFYPAGSQSKVILEQAHQQLERALNTFWQQRALKLPYKTPYELLIAASILEKEAALPQEKRLISGVLVNRLRKNMPLQMDPTVIYALGTQYQGKLTHDDLHVDSPYNSYRYRGLPPTPIAMVGLDALDAAAHPITTDYLYFVARGDGSHEFSVTYEQQKQAIARYLRSAHSTGEGR